MKKKTKKLISIILSIVLGIGIITAGVILFKPKDTKRIYPTYRIGSVDENGEYVESDDAIYSDLFECQGLKVEPNFNSNVTYSVFFYRFDESLVDSELNLTTTFEATENDIVKYARIVIMPDLGDKSKEEHKLWIWNIPGVADDIKVTVNNTQPPMKNYAEIKEPGSWTSFTNEEFNRLEAINLSNINKLAFVFEGGIDDVFEHVDIQNYSKVNSEISSHEISENCISKSTSKLWIVDVSTLSYDYLYVSIKASVKLSIYKYA